jgi:hypothetical protein
MSNEFGILAEFKTPKDLYHAAEETVKKGYTNFDTYSPFPIHGMDKAMNLKPSKLGWIVAIGGSFGLIGAISMQWWMALDYPYILSGKEFFAYPASIPVNFELMVLASAFSAVIGMFTLNKLPMLYHPLLKCKSFKGASSDKFFLAVESTDKKYVKQEVVDFFNSAGAINVEVIED